MRVSPLDGAALNGGAHGGQDSRFSADLDRPPRERELDRPWRRGKPDRR